MAFLAQPDPKDQPGLPDLLVQPGLLGLQDQLVLTALCRGLQALQVQRVILGQLAPQVRPVTSAWMVLLAPLAPLEIPDQKGQLVPQGRRVMLVLQVPRVQLDRRVMQARLVQQVRLERHQVLLVPQVLLDLLELLVQQALFIQLVDRLIVSSMKTRSPSRRTTRSRPTTMLVLSGL